MTNMLVVISLGNSEPLHISLYLFVNRIRYLADSHCLDYTYVAFSS